MVVVVSRCFFFFSGAGIENNDPFPGDDFPGTLKRFESCETRCSFRTNKETFFRSDFAGDADHFFVIDCNRSAMGIAKDWRAARGLDSEHAWSFFSDPAQRFHLVERFPHANQSGAAAGRIKNRVWEFPVKLLG